MPPAPDRNLPRRSPQLTLWIVAAVLSGMMLLYELAPRRGSDGGRHPLVGVTPPALALQPLDGGREASLVSLAGKVALVNFWGTWCGPCQLELPEIGELYDQFRSRDDFRLLAVSCGGGADQDIAPVVAETRRFVAAQKIDLPQYTDRAAATRRALQFAGSLDGFAYPTTIVLDRRGVIRGAWVGYERGSGNAMARLVGDLLRE